MLQQIRDEINYTAAWWPNWEQTALMYIPLLAFTAL